MPSAFNLTAQLQFAMSPASLAGIRNQIQASLSGIRIADLGVEDFTKGSQALKSFAASGQLASQSMRSMGAGSVAAAGQLAAMNKVVVSADSAIERLSTQVSLAGKRFVSFGIAAGSIVAFTGAITRAAHESIDFARQMNRIQITAGGTASEMSAVEAEIRRLSTTYGTSSKSLADAALTIRQAGFDLRQTKAALAAISQADVSPSFGSMAKTLDALIAASRTFNVEAKDFSSTIGAIGAVASTTAVESENLTTVISKVGSVAKVSGVDLNQLISVFSAVRDSSRASSDEISTGLRNVLLRIQRPETIQYLRQLGIELEHTAESSRRLTGGDSKIGSFIGGFEALKSLATATRGLQQGDSRLTQITEVVAGYRQASHLIGILNNWEQVEKNVATAQSGSALAALQQEKAMTTLSAAADRTKESWNQLVSAFTKSTAFDAMARSALDLANGLIKVAEYAGPLLPMLASLAAVRIGSSIIPSIANIAKVANSPAGVQIIPQVTANPARRYSRGGSVPGVGDSDSVFSLLTPGEFVLSKRAVASIGQAQLHRMNAMGQIAHFQEGGVVGDDERMRRYGLRKKQVLNDKDRDAILLNNLGYASKLSSRYAKQLGGDEEATQESRLQLLLASRTFDPLNPRKGTKNADAIVAAAQAGDWQNEDLNRYFRFHATRSTYSALRRNAEKRGKLGLTDFDTAGVTQPTSREAAPDDPDVLMERAKHLAYIDSLETAARNRQDAPTAKLGNNKTLLERMRRRRAGLPETEYNGRLARLPGGPLSYEEPPYVDAQYTSRLNRGLLLTDQSAIPFAGPSASYLPTVPPEAYPQTSGYYGFADTPRGERIHDASGRYAGRRRGVYNVQGPLYTPPEQPLPANTPTNRENAYQDLALAEAKRRQRAAAQGGIDPLTLPLNERYSGADLARTRLTQYLAPSVSLPDLIGQRASTKIDADIATRGGRVSKQTLGQLTDSATNDQRSKLSKELLDAEKKLLAETLKSASAEERSRISRENVEKALAGKEQVVVRDGRLLGTAGTVNAATAAGISVPGLGWLGRADRFVDAQYRRAAGAVGGGFGRVGRFLGGINDRLANSALGRVASTPLALALPYASTITDHLAGDADTAARSGAAGSANYARYRGASGAIQGAVVGGTIGSLGGPLGTLAGAGIGGVYGFISSLKDAEQEIRSIKIGDAISQFGDNLTTLTNQLSNNGTLDPGTLARVREAHALSANGIRERAAADSTSFFGSFDAGRYVSSTNREFRDQFAPSLGGISQVLSREASRLGRTGGNLSPDQLTERLLAGNGGTNRTLLQTAAQVRGLSTQDILRELRKDFESGRNSAFSERTNQAGRQAEERSSNSMYRLAQNVAAAADSLEMLRGQSRTLAEIFEGMGHGPITVSAGTSKLNGLGRNDYGFLSPLQIVRSVGGEAGQGLFNSGRTIDAISRQLPGVLATAASRNHLEGQDLVTSVQTDLARSLGYDLASLPREFKQEFDVIVRNLQGLMDGNRGVGGFTDEYRNDPTKLVERLIGGRAEAVRTNAATILHQVEEQANAFIQGLERVAKATHQIGETLDKSSLLSSQGARTRLEFALDRQNQGGRFHEFTTLGEQEAPFDIRQQRLTGLGANANNPRAIGALLASLRPQIQAAEARQQAVFERTGGEGQEFRAAAQELTNLRDRAANAQRALQHLGDAAERNASAQERLGRLVQERDARRGLGERYLTSDGAGRAQILRSATLASIAVRNGSLDGLHPEAQGQVLQFLRSAGRATLNLGGQRITGDDAANRLIDQSAGGVFGLDHNQQNELQTLQQTIGERFQVAETAMQTFVADLTRGRDAFFENLTQQHSRFFQTLSGVFLNRERLNETRNEQGTVGARRGQLAELAAHQQTLASFGITNDDQLRSFNLNRGDFQGLAAAYSRQAELRQRGRTAAAAVGRNVFGDDDRFLSLDQASTDRISGILGDNGVTAPQISRIISSFNTSTGFIRGNNYNRPLTRDQALGILRGSITNEVGGGLEANAASRDITQITGRLQRSIPGINIGAAANALNGPNGQRVFQAADAFGNRQDGVTLGNLNQQIAASNDQFNTLTQRLTALNGVLAAMEQRAGVAAQPQARAMGGRIRYLATGGGIDWTPRGTDRVPALLSENEFVVNAASAQANAGLLEEINNSRGQPIQLANGGSVSGIAALAAMNPFGAAGLYMAQGRAAGRLPFNLSLSPAQRATAIAAAVNAHSQYGQAQNLAIRQTLANDHSRQADFRAFLGVQGNAYGTSSAYGAEAAHNNSFVSGHRRRAGGAFRFATGGRVPQLLASGGSVEGGGGPDFNQFAVAANNLNVGMHGFSESASRLQQALLTFAGNSNHLADVMSKFPSRLEVQGTHQVNVTINGAEVFNNLEPAFKKMVVDRVRTEINKVFHSELPEAGVTV